MNNSLPRNFYLEVEYDGTDFHGWQIQEGKRLRTVQGAIEKALRQIFHKKIRVAAAGRTDTGVHARMQAISFHVPFAIPADALMRACNAILPGDVRVKRARRAKGSFNARYSCKGRTYRYFILNRFFPDVFARNYSWWIPEQLNVAVMRTVACAFIGERDFSSFTNERDSYEGTCRRTVRNISIRRQNESIRIEIEADGFLRKMVRNIVSVLVEAGSGKRSAASVKRILRGKNRDLVGKPAPACGLFLWRLKYDKKYFYTD